MTRVLLLVVLAACSDPGLRSPVPRRLVRTSSVAVSEPRRVEEGTPPEAERPAEPVETRDLLLSLVDDETGEPVALSVQLWRISLPEDDVWTAGDARHADLEVPAEGLRVANLPEGRYRIYSPWLRFGRDDPPAFRPGGVRLAVPVCRRRRVFLKVLDGRGRVLTRAVREDGGCSGSSRFGADVPPWRVERRRKDGTGRRGLGGTVRGCGRGSPEPYAIRGDARGFDLGTFREDSRAMRSDSWHSFTFEGRTRASLNLTHEVTRDRTCVAVALPLERVLDSVFLPDGATAAGAYVLCRAVLEGSPTNVTVRVPEYEDLVFPYRPGDLLPARTLQR